MRWLTRSCCSSSDRLMSRRRLLLLPREDDEAAEAEVDDGEGRGGRSGKQCQESPKEDDGAILNGGEEGVLRRLWKRASSMALWRAAIISRIAEVLERQSRRMSLMPVWPKEQEA
ncbi:hypothetical protein OPV22_014096 [Ensete ventricosum]|uniref:Uncharacterized protein n=1 Tax=Ensete ventricosum TaxID=4639 RepID=A0AAV8R0V8_ENSVE|nr:hypothetical protein OPV22_014096 [Ensete ventricosum]